MLYSLMFFGDSIPSTGNYSNGMLQYIYPILMFLIGAVIYNEPLNEAKIGGFFFIWIALIIYLFEGIKNKTRYSIQ